MTRLICSTEQKKKKESCLEFKLRPTQLVINGHRDGGTVTSGATVPLRRRHEGKLPTSRFRGSNRRLIRVAYFVKSIRENHVSGINCRWPSNVPSSKQSEKVSDKESRRGERRGQGDRRKKKKIRERSRR